MRPLLAILVYALLASAHAAPSVALSLQECYRRALSHVESIAMQGADIQAAEGRYRQARGEMLPQITARASEFLQDTSGLNAADSAFSSSFTRQSRPEVALNLTQPLFRGLREFHALAASRAERTKYEQLYARAQQLLFLDVADAYLSVIAHEDDLAVLRSQRNVLQERITELAHRVTLGQSRTSEIAATEAQLRMLDGDMARIEGLQNVARSTLGFLTGVDTAHPLQTPPQPTVAPLETYVAQAYHRPDVIAATQDHLLAGAQQKATSSELLPEVYLETNYYPYRVGYQQESDWDVRFTLEVPIFRGGITRGRVQEAKAKLRRAALAQAEQGRRAVQEVREEYDTFRAAQREAVALQRAARAAHDAYALQRVEYQHGLVSNLEVLQALRDYYEMKRRATATTVATTRHAYDVMVAAGTLP
ncbi:MAG: TolC family protein [Deltaproteobacteria bacterium]|nr:TolC family protein [Deltaproteobacteria bacterium]